MSEMNNDEFDVELARMLRRVDAPEGFAAKVVDCAAADTRVRESGSGATGVVARGKLVVMPRVHAWMSGAIAAVLVMGCLVVERVHVVRQQEQVAVTEQQFETAIRVTNRALDQTNEQLARAGLKLGE